MHACIVGLYNPFLVYCRELAPRTVSLTRGRAQSDDSKHDSHYSWDGNCIFIPVLSMRDTQARTSLRCSSKISCAVLVPEDFVISMRIPSKHVKSGHYRPASKTPSERRFAGGPIVARDWKLAGHIICRCRPLNSFAVSSAANSIDPDQT